MIPEEYEEYVKRIARNTNNNQTEKIKWKEKKMKKKHWQNWQYATTKEVLAIHEVIEPYDWELDLEVNPDFALWEKEMWGDK